METTEAAGQGVAYLVALAAFLVVGALLFVVRWRRSRDQHRRPYRNC